MKKKNSFIPILSAVLIFGLLMMDMALHKAPAIFGWVSVWYGADYSVGFSSRLFVGSFLHLLCGPYITVSQAYTFLLVSLATICALFSCFAGICLKKAQENDTTMATAVLLFTFLCSPASFGYLWTVENMGRLETFLLFFVLLMLLVCVTVKNRYVNMAVILLTGAVSLSVHQVFLLLYFPVVLCILLEYFFAGIKAKNKALPICSFLTALLLGAIGLFFQFGTKINFSTPESLLTYLREKSEMPIDIQVITQEYFWEFSEHYTNNYLPEAYDRAKYGFMTFVFLCPILFVFGYVWVKAFKLNKDKTDRVRYVLTLLSNVTFVPAFVFLTDWGRWFAAFYFVQLVMILYLVCRKDAGMWSAMMSLERFVRKCPVLFLAILLYLSMFEKFEGCNYVNEVADLYHFIYNIIH